MKTIHSNPKIKATARGQLLGHYSVPLFAHLYAGGMLMILSDFFRVLISPVRYTQFIIFALVEFILLLMSGLFTVGLCRLHLQLARGKEAPFLLVMSGFFQNSDKTLKAELVIGLHILLRTIPFWLCYSCYLIFSYRFLLLLSIPMLVTALLHALILQINYSQVFFLINDDPDANLRELLEGSTLLMMGHKMQYARLLLSFLGLYLVSILSFGIGFLWTKPYFFAAKTAFYQQLIKNWRRNG